MTFGRWLLVHSFSIFLVVVLLLGYLYRDELQLQQAYNQLLNLQKPQEVIKTLTQKKEVAASTESEKEQRKPEPVVSKPAQTVQPVKPSTIPDKKPELAVQPTIDETVPDQINRLYNARQAFWDRDYQNAIREYQQLIDQNPLNADYSGELGNVYYVLNDYNNAAELYFRTAQLLLRQGQRDEARQLLAPINAMNRELGDKLKQQLEQN
jgi:TolA-binding protein